MRRRGAPSRRSRGPSRRLALGLPGRLHHPERQHPPDRRLSLVHHFHDHAVAARRLLMLTDVAGVKGKDGALIPKMTASQARAAIADGTIQGGMIPKVETCLHAVERGVDGAVIIDGRVPHAVLLELFTEHGAGTLIVPD